MDTALPQHLSRKDSADLQVRDSFDKCLEILKKHQNTNPQHQLAECKVEKGNNETPKGSIDPSTILNQLVAPLEQTQSLPCLYGVVLEAFKSIPSMLNEVLKGEDIDQKDYKTDQVTSVLEALLTITTGIRSAPTSLFCRFHQGNLLNEFEWPSSFVRSLLSYLTQKTDFTSKIDKLLIRILELVIDPPKDFGNSKSWLVLAREIEEQMILEDSQVCHFLSSIFVFLSSQARIRICGSIQEYLISMLDPDIIPTLSQEMLTFFYLVSFNRKTQQALISEQIPTILVEWMCDSFISNKNNPQEGYQEKLNIIIQILVNITQSLDKSGLDDLVGLLHNKAFLYCKTSQDITIYNEILSPIFQSIPFSSFTPICLHVNNTFELPKIDMSAFGNAGYNELLDKEPSIFTKGQYEGILKSIEARNPRPTLSVDYFWNKVDLHQSSNYVSTLKSADAILAVLSFSLGDKQIKLGTFIGEGTQVESSALSSTSSPKDFLFSCVDDKYTDNFQNQPFKFKMGLNLVTSVSIDILYTKKDYVHLSYRNSQVLVNSQSTFNVFEDHFIGQYHKCHLDIWVGTSVFTEKQAQKPLVNESLTEQPNGIYSSVPLSVVVKESFQSLRPNNELFFVPKDLTLKEFFDAAFQNSQGIVNKLHAYYEQNLLSIDTKISELNPTFGDQMLSQIIDLNIYHATQDSAKLKSKMLEPQETYNTIMNQSSWKIRRPLLKHVSVQGPLTFFKKFCLDGQLNIDPYFVEVYTLIVKEVGPYMELLTSALSTDLMAILFQILFTSNNQKKDIVKSFYRIIMGKLGYSNLLASDPKQLYEFLMRGLEVLVNSGSVFASNLFTEAQSLLGALREAELIQDRKLMSFYLQTVFEKGDTFQNNSVMIWDNLFLNQEISQKIEDLFTKGFSLLTPHCKDQKFNRNFTRLSQGVIIFMKLTGYRSVLFQDESFEITLADLVLTLQSQFEDLHTIIISEQIEEYLSKLIHWAYGAMAKVIQNKVYIASEPALMDVAVYSLNIFNLLEDELNTIRSQQYNSAYGLIKARNVVDNVIQVLKIPIQNHLTFSNGTDPAKQYLSGMDKLSTASTLAKVFETLETLPDNFLSLQIQVPILELLQAWSSHPVLKQLFDSQIEENLNAYPPRMSMKFSEFCSNYLTKMQDNIKERKEVNKNTNTELETKVTTLLRSILNNSRRT